MKLPKYLFFLFLVSSQFGSLFNSQVLLAQEANKPIEQNVENKNKSKESAKEIEKYLVINNFKSDYLTSFENSFVNKLLLQVSTRQTEFRVLLSKLNTFDNPKATLVHLELILIKEGNRFLVKALLTDFKNKKIVNRIKIENIKDENKIKAIQKALNQLFEPINKESLKKKSKLNSNKNTTSSSSSAQKQVDTGLVDFKQRVLSLKSGLAKKFKALNEAKKKEKDKENVTSSEDSSKTEKSNKTNQLSSQKNKLASQSGKKKKGEDSPNYGSTSYIDLGLIWESIDSTDLIETNSLLQYLTLGYSKIYYLDAGKNSSLKFYGKFGTNMSNVAEAIGNYLSIMGAYQRRIFGKVGAYVGGSYQTLNFVNLPKAGNLKKPANNNLMAIDLGLTYSLEAYGKETLLSVAYKSVISSSSDYQTLASNGLTGSILTLSATLKKIYKAMGLKLSYSTIDLSSEGSRPVTASGSSIVINGIYEF